jgi:hypothetical protein
MADNKTWKQKRMYFVHEQNSGVALVKGNVKLTERYLKLFIKEKITLEELVEEIEKSNERILAGVQKIKDSQDYIYNQIKDLE